MAGGRPTTYGPETLVKARAYIDSCVDEDYRLIKSESSQGESFENKTRVKIPTIEGLGAYVGAARATIYLWKEEHQEFSDIIDELQQIQAERLMNNGLSGTYNPTIAKVLLAKHGYVEKQEVTGANGGALITWAYAKQDSDSVHSEKLVDETSQVDEPLDGVSFASESG